MTSSDDIQLYIVFAWLTQLYNDLEMEIDLGPGWKKCEAIRENIWKSHDWDNHYKDNVDGKDDESHYVDYIMLTDLLKISKIQNDENGKKLDFDKILVALQNAYDSAHGLDAFKIFAKNMFKVF